MAHQLRIRFSIPIDIDREESGPMVFSHWLPIGLDHGLTVHADPYTIVFWFDVQATEWAHKHSEESIRRTVNVQAHRIYADVQTDRVDDEIFSFMQRNNPVGSVTDENVSLEENCQRHGREVLVPLLTALNRLIDFVRVEKGQFWLAPFDYDLDSLGGFAVWFKAKAQIDDGPWFRWEPCLPEVFTANMGDERRYLTKADWVRAQEFASATTRPQLALDLLSGAERLASLGYHRAALVEAVAALETALHSFAQNPEAQRSIPQEATDRMGLETLPNVTKRLGLTASIAFILPLLFQASELSSNVLQDCRAAIKERQNVIHNSKRRVDDQELRRHHRAVRQVTEILISATQKAAP